MIEEMGFRLVCVFTSIYLGFIVDLIGCEVAGFAYGLTWCAMAASNISYHADDVLVDGFDGASEFSLLSGRYICVFDAPLVHKVLTDGDGAVFEIMGLGKDP